MSIENENIVSLIKCVNFAAIKHKNQKRKDPEETPYINHPIGVAYILTNEAGITCPIILQAAILHDTVEDTDTTLDEIEQEFGSKVREIVAECSDDKSLSKLERKRQQIEKSTKTSYEGKMVKLADKLYNLRDLERCRPKNWTQERVNEYFQWARQVCNGLRNTSPKLEALLDEIFQRHT